MTTIVFSPRIYIFSLPSKIWRKVIMLRFSIYAQENTSTPLNRRASLACKALPEFTDAQSIQIAVRHMRSIIFLALFVFAACAQVPPGHHRPTLDDNFVAQVRCWWGRSFSWPRSKWSRVTTETAASITDALYSITLDVAIVSMWMDFIMASFLCTFACIPDFPMTSAIAFTTPPSNTRLRVVTRLAMNNSFTKSSSVSLTGSKWLLKMVVATLATKATNTKRVSAGAYGSFSWFEISSTR